MERAMHVMHVSHMCTQTEAQTSMTHRNKAHVLCLSCLRSQWSNELGSVYKINILTKPCYIVSAPDVADKILNGRGPDKCFKAPQVRQFGCCISCIHHTAKYALGHPARKSNPHCSPLLLYLPVNPPCVQAYKPYEEVSMLLEPNDKSEQWILVVPSR